MPLSARNAARLGASSSRARRAAKRLNRFPRLSDVPDPIAFYSLVPLPRVIRRLRSGGIRQSWCTIAQRPWQSRRLRRPLHLHVSGGAAGFATWPTTRTSRAGRCVAAWVERSTIRSGAPPLVVGAEVLSQQGGRARGSPTGDVQFPSQCSHVRGAFVASRVHPRFCEERSARLHPEETQARARRSGTSSRSPTSRGWDHQPAEPCGGRAARAACVAASADQRPDHAFELHYCRRLQIARWA